MYDKDIFALKLKGKSLRQIATIFGVSHKTITKRLRTISLKDQMSTDLQEKQLTGPTTIEEQALTSSNVVRSIPCRQSKGTVEPPSTQKAPSSSMGEGVNPPQKAL